MHTVFENIIERLENASFWTDSSFDEDGYCNDDSEEAVYLHEAIEIVKQEAEKYEECYKDCGDCEVYDNEKFHCPKFCKVIKETVKEIEENHNGWIPCSERLPDNAEHKGSICPRYHIMTIYGQTVGWFNPDYDSWFVLVWFMTARYLESEIDMERGDIPKVVRAPQEYGIVTAWQPLPEPYQPKGE